MAVKFKILFIALLLGAALFPLFPQSVDLDKKKTKREKVLKVLDLTRVPEIYVATLLGSLRQSPISEDDKKLYCKHSTAESLSEAFVPVYMELYTEEELDAMIEFYSSPAGISIIGKSPEVVEKLREVNLEWQIEVSVKVKNEKAKNAVQDMK